MRNGITGFSKVAVIGLCMLVLDLPARAGESPEVPRVAPGWDWSLPSYVKPVAYSGFVTWSPKRFQSGSPSAACTCRGRN